MRAFEFVDISNQFSLVSCRFANCPGESVCICGVGYIPRMFFARVAFKSLRCQLSRWTSNYVVMIYASVCVIEMRT